MHSFSKQQQGIFCVREVCIALPSCQLLVNAPKIGIHSTHGLAELAQPLSFQSLLLCMQPVTDRQRLYERIACKRSIAGVVVTLVLSKLLGLTALVYPECTKHQALEHTL